MKRKLGAVRPDWLKWSDGRPLTVLELKRFKHIRRSPLPGCKPKGGESPRAYFERIRGVVEAHEANKAKMVVKPAGLLSRAWSWLNGRPSPVKVQVKRA